MSRVLSVLLLGSVFLGGCVPLSMHGALREAYDKLEAQNQAIKQELAQATAESKRLQQEAASLKAANEALTRQAKDLAANLQQLNRDNAGLDEQAASAQAVLAAREAEKTARAVKAEEQKITLQRRDAARAAVAAQEAEKTARAVKAEEQKIALQRREAAKTPPPVAAPVVALAQKQPIRSLEDALKDELADGSGFIRRGENMLTIEILEPVLYYNSASATITPAGLKVLKRIAALLKDGADKEIRIEAHTDVAIHTSHFPSNMELTVARATGVLRFLKTQNVAPQTRLSAVGYADSQPVSANDTPRAKNRNRRVEIVVRSR